MQASSGLSSFSRAVSGLAAAVFPLFLLIIGVRSWPLVVVGCPARFQLGGPTMPRCGGKLARGMTPLGVIGETKTKTLRGQVG